MWDGDHDGYSAVGNSTLPTLTTEDGTRMRAGRVRRTKHMPYHNAGDFSFSVINVKLLIALDSQGNKMIPEEAAPNFSHR